jgi:hypothetical protein
MLIGSYLISFSINRQYFNIIIIINKYNIYSKKESRVLRDIRFKKKGNTRVLKNYIEGYYKEYKTFGVLLLRRSIKQNAS